MYFLFGSRDDRPNEVRIVADMANAKQATAKNPDNLIYAKTTTTQLIRH